MAGTITAAGRMTFRGRRYPDGQTVAVRVEDGKVVGVEPIQTVDRPAGSERWIVPGFFDVQVNGFAGRNFIDPRVSVKDVRTIATAVLRTGVTRFLPTVITADLEVMCRQLAVIAEAMAGDPLVSAMCPGIHLEGPFLHPEDGPRGAHPRQHIRPTNLADYQRLAEAARGRIAMLTLAPDRPGGPELIRYAARQGVVVGLGHHRASADMLEIAIAAGARISTHLGNGADALLPRHANYVWEQLGDDRLWASFIADGHHLPPRVLRCMLRAKTPMRSILITDAVGAAGMPPGPYLLGETEVERTAEGKVVLPGTPYQAGSSADVPTVIGRAVLDGGVSFQEAVSMASDRPAALMSRGAEQWSCLPGSEANVVEMDWCPGDGRIAIRQVAFGRFAVTSGD